MSVLQFSRKREVFVEEPVVVEINKPIPLGMRTAKAIKSSKLSKAIKKGLIAIFMLAMVCLYPALIVNAHKIGDDLRFPESIHQNWSSHWAGVSAILLSQEVDVNGWSLDVHEWMPSARLTAKPVFQETLAVSIGEFTQLVGQQVGGDAVGDLQTVSFLLSGEIDSNEIRAAKEALSSYNGGVRLRRYDDSLTSTRYTGRLELLAGWMETASFNLQAVAGDQAEGLFSTEAIQSVTEARARAYIAHRYLSFMEAPIGLSIKSEHEAAILALEKVVNFDPLLILNGRSDGLFLPSHPEAIYMRVVEAERALKAAIEQTDIQMQVK